MEFIESINLAKKQLGNDLFANLNISFEESDEFVVCRNDNAAIIKYNETIEIFRGLTYVKEHIGEKEYSKKIERKFSNNGLMLDCSRNGVVNIQSLKNLILLQALMGQNRILLYTEDTYELKKYPYFGYLRGSYSKEEIVEIVEYASSFGVEVVPCIQTLGHLNRFVHWEANNALKDGPTTLLIDSEETYVFIEECIKFCRESFKSNVIHIGMDESTEIGLGRYLKKHGMTNRTELFSRHLSRVINICEKYNFKPMIWSDMFFRLGSENEDYYRSSPLNESVISLIPDNVELVYWDYYHRYKHDYNEQIIYHIQTKKPISFAGGAWRWKGFAPSIEESMTFSRSAISACVDNGVKSVFVTAWGDNGNECTIYSSLPVMALFASVDYFNKDDDATISSLLKAITGDDLNLFMLMDTPDRPNKVTELPENNSSKYFLYQDPLCGMFDGMVRETYSQNYKDISKDLANASLKSYQFGYIYHTLSLLCDVLSNKVCLGIDLRKAYKENNRAKLKELSDKITVLLEQLERLNEAHRQQWNLENKPFGFDVVDGRNGYLKNRLISARLLINQYLTGKINRIEELELEILPFNGHTENIGFNVWEDIVTPHYL